MLGGLTTTQLVVAAGVAILAGLVYRMWSDGWFETDRDKIGQRQQGDWQTKELSRIRFLPRLIAVGVFLLMIYWMKQSGFGSSWSF